MSGPGSSVLPSLLILGTVAVVAVALTLGRDWAEGSARQSRSAARLALAVILVQAIHFAEELEAGLPARFPALMGLAPMPLGLFVSFNVAWLAIWLVSARGLAGHHRAALFPLWFLGLAGVLNGFAHPALAALAGGYFPGLWTAPAVGVLGFLLVRRLLAITRRVDLPSGAA